MGRAGAPAGLRGGRQRNRRELFSLHHPKIVITDISIPICSGLELAREFVEADSEVRILVITGYGSFENVRDSVLLGAIDLLPKPIIPADLNASLRKAAEHLASLQRQHHTQRALGELISENQDLLRERCIARLFSRPAEGGEDRIRQQLQLLSLSFPHRNFAAVLIQLEPDRSDALGGAAFPTAFKKLCDSAFSANGFRAFSYFSTADRLDCLVNYPFDQGDERIEALLAKLLDETKFYFGAGFSAYIGSQVQQLSAFYRSAEQALLANRFSGDSGIVNYRNLGALTPACGGHPEFPVAELVECAQRFQRSEFRSLLEQSCLHANLEQHRDLALELLSQLAHACFQSGAYPWSAVNYPDTVAKIFSTSSEEEVREILLTACSRLMDVLYQQRMESTNQLIVLAKTYIQENLGNPDLSLDLVSSHIGLSKIYFCQLFHKEEGVSFSTYLNAERIRRAKTLLRDTSLKIFEISDQTGYRNPKYFNYVFKHIAGVTPLEYRRDVK